ncbi:alpha-(1,3)-fucosyltransferase C, partial [Hyalella azteca]|uniref:Fucosyltransferase n=1 Tax=Hyalella azteca TaxID=294128 RepID=A0A8B7PML0_HYAAZ
GRARRERHGYNGSGGARAVLSHGEYNVPECGLRIGEPPGVYDLKGKRSLKSLMAEGNTGSLGFFNWTATYSQSSNIVVAPRVAALASHVSTTKKFLLKGLKKKLVAWYPPECVTDSGREKMGKKLAGLQVDVYGRCGTEVCPAHGCWQYLSMRYIFYLSFENNLCIDYISDQVWEPLKAGLIPVVYGGANYTRTLPRNSFIDAREHSAANLTSLLIKLSSNSSELGKYHEWRSFFTIENEDFYGQLCSKVHEIRRRPFWSVAVQPAQNLTNNPLHKWWLNVNKCWTDYPRKRVNSYAANVGSVLKFIKKLQMIY